MIMAAYVTAEVKVHGLIKGFCHSGVWEPFKFEGKLQ